MTSDAGLEAWQEHTSAFDRVQAVAETIKSPQSAAEIAATAGVAENTARNHLERLVEMNVLLQEEKNRTAVYYPDPLHTRAQTLRELVDTHDQGALLELKSELQATIERWQSTYAVDSPDALRATAAETETVEETQTIRHTANDWELIQYRLSIVDEAIRHYAAFSRDGVSA